MIKKKDKSKKKSKEKKEKKEKKKGRNKSSKSKAFPKIRKGQARAFPVQWQRISTAEKNTPNAFYGHSLTPIPSCEGSFYLFGGGKNDKEFTSELYLLQMRDSTTAFSSLDFSWTLLVNDDDGNEEKESKSEESSLSSSHIISPFKRNFHSAVMYSTPILFFLLIPTNQSFLHCFHQIQFISFHLHYVIPIYFFVLFKLIYVHTFIFKYVSNFLHLCTT